VTRGWFPQRAGSPSLNDGEAAAAVPPYVGSTAAKRILVWVAEGHETILSSM